MSRAAAAGRTVAPFAHLHVASAFSAHYGVSWPEDLVAAAAAADMDLLACTDRDGLYGAARFMRACTNEGIKPLLGASVTVRQQGDRARTPPHHLVLLATDDTGYANLCRLLTDAHMLGERGDPWVDPVQICAHAAGLMAIAGPRSHPGRAAIAGRIDGAARLLDPFREAFGRDRTTAGHACAQVEDRRDDPGFDSRLQALETCLRALPEARA